MKSVDYLIIGGSAAGTTAAEVVRSLKPDSLITIISDEGYEQYSRVLLPYYTRREINREQLFLKNPQWYQQKNIELIKNNKAIGFSPKEHFVNCNNGQIYQYGKLLLTIGGDVARLAIPGADLGNILYFRTIEDADRIIETASVSKKAIIVGGGFISLDFATSFRANNVSEVTILIREPYYWSGKLDSDSSKIIENVLGENGVRVVTGEEVENFLPNSSGKVGKVVTKSGKIFECDVVGVGIGIRSVLSWLDGSGIKINRAIVTNEYLETNLRDVYAAGDCAEFYDVIFAKQHTLGNWANATSQGLAVGKTLAGIRTLFETASSYSDKFFDSTYSFIGITEESFADEVVSRVSVEEGRMTRIFIKTIEGVVRVVGATVINDPAEVAPLTTAVKSKVDILSHKDKLINITFDLKTLIS